MKKLLGIVILSLFISELVLASNFSNIRGEKKNKKVNCDDIFGKNINKMVKAGKLFLIIL